MTAPSLVFESYAAGADKSHGKGRELAGIADPARDARLLTVESAPMERWTFGEFVLDPEARELLRAGAPVSLSPKAFQLLGVLVESQPRALSRSELQDRLWPDTFVVEKNLTNLVSEIREALGDDPAQPRFIRTVHRFGYAFAESRTESADPPRHNLPAELTHFIGRDREIAELESLVAATRLLTVTGAGGCGKTRLGLEVAARMSVRFADGVWFVDLSALAEPVLVTQAVASVLGVRERPQRSIGDALADYVRNRELLIVFDNCEHLIAAAAQLAEALLRAAARLRVLATSREALGIMGERVWRVPSLTLPESAQTVTADTVLQFDAVRLLVERARTVDPDFTVTAATAITIAEVCHRLDGIPLAIELAAARLKVLSIDQISARLNDRFRLLTGGSRTAIARQRTLEATVDWSYDLLLDPERRLLRRLSVFAGGWTIEAAEEVTAVDGSTREDVLDFLSRLVDKSLVNVEREHDESRRYRFLETVRQYARERLLDTGEAALLRDRHLSCFHALAQRAAPELTRADQIAWLNRLEREHDNLRAALEWCLTAPDRGAQSMELAVALKWFWLKRGYLREGQEYIERALAAGADLPPGLRAHALMGLGSFLFFQGDLARAQAVLAESAALARAVGDLTTVGFVLGLSSIAALETGDVAETIRLATESQTAARASTTPWIEGPALSSFAYLAVKDGDHDAAASMHEHTLALSRQQGEKWGVGITLFDLAVLRLLQHRFAEARALAVEGIVLNQQFAAALGVAWCLGILSCVDAADGDTLRAAQLRGAMEGLLESIGAPVQESFKRLVGDHYLQVMRQALGEPAFQQALAEGRAMSLPRAIAFGLT